MNRTTDRPLVNLMATRGYKSANAVNPKGGYWEPSIIIAQISNHKIGHYVRPNKVAQKYFDLQKGVDLNAHVKVFNFVVKVNAIFFEKYIINAFSYTQRDMASN